MSYTVYIATRKNITIIDEHNSSMNILSKFRKFWRASNYQKYKIYMCILINMIYWSTFLFDLFSFILPNVYQVQQGKPWTELSADQDLSTYRL